FHFFLFNFITLLLFFLSTDTSPSDLYTLSLHDALPIFGLFDRLVRVPQHLQSEFELVLHLVQHIAEGVERRPQQLDDVVELLRSDRKSTRLNSSHVAISYAVFCLKKKKQKEAATNIEAP